MHIFIHMLNNNIIINGKKIIYKCTFIFFFDRVWCCFYKRVSANKKRYKVSHIKVRTTIK